MIKVYTNKNCGYCTELKNGLNDLKIEFKEIDIDENKEEVNEVFKFIGVEVVPIIIIKPHVLVPNRSFKTIKEAIKLINSLI